jgi:hypothetical protein
VGVAEVGTDEGAPVPALRAEPFVAEDIPHQLHPQGGDAGHVDTEGAQRDREPIARERWDDHIEAVGGFTAVGTGVGQRVDDMVEVPERPGPAVRRDQWERLGPAARRP